MSNSVANSITPYLPFLRRFARALTGSQERGDSYVVAMLETLLVDQKLFNRTLHPKVAVYQAFLKVWSSMPMNRDREEAENNSGAADRRIETLSHMPRQAFLLAALEEFSTADIATILGVSDAEVKTLIDTAGREISEHLAARVLIIEDEPLIALDIEGIVMDIGHEVVGIARTRKEATDMALTTKPELVLADIQLADGSSGIDAVSEILERINIPVIFITAYPERLLTGERAEPTFLITKPFRPEMVKATISQALFFDMKARSEKGAAA